MVAREGAGTETMYDPALRSVAQTQGRAVNQPRTRRSRAANLHTPTLHIDVGTLSMFRRLQSGRAAHLSIDHHHIVDLQAGDGGVLAWTMSRAARVLCLSACAARPTHTLSGAGASRERVPE